MAWRPVPVPGWEDFYEVSDRGEIRSLPRQTLHGVMGGRLLAGYVDAGYLTVKIGRHNKRKVHLLVLGAFVGPRPPGQVARHGPGGSLDNRWPENLSYGTITENVRDRVRDGTNSSQLVISQVRDIRALAAAGVNQYLIAEQFGITQSSVSSIVRRKTWIEAGPVVGIRQPEFQPCGTPAAAARHYRHGEPLDEACRRARNLYSTERKARKRHELSLEATGIRVTPGLPGGAS